MKTLIERSGKKVNEICYRLDIAPSTLTKWKSGDNVPHVPITKIPIMLEVLGCTLDELVEAANETQRQVAVKATEPEPETKPKRGRKRSSGK